jgi:putative transcriptional regulator
MAEIARRLDVTTQAVSEYIKLMIQDNLVIKKNGEYRLTQEGVEFLHGNISELKDFVDLKVADLNIINVCTAIANKDLNKGDKVDLKMSNGKLMAIKTSTPQSQIDTKSNGVILYDVKAGDDVAVVELKGIIEYDYGSLTILTLPPTTKGGSKLVPIEKFNEFINKTKPECLAVYDLIGYALLQKIDLKPHIEFSVVSASIEAAQKGFNVLLLTATDTLSEIISQIEHSNSQTKNIIHYSVIPWKNI